MTEARRSMGATKRTGFVWHERMMWHDLGAATGPVATRGIYQPGVHVENPETKRRLKNLLDGYDVTPSLELIHPRQATEEEILSVHAEGYLERVRQLSAGQGGDAGEFALLGPGSYEIALLAAGAAISGAEAIATGAVTNAYVLSRPPGHHAEPDRGRGFCIFSNIGIAIRHLRDRFGIGRVAVVDFDVHHGNGTETIFYEDAQTLTISLHQDGLYPVGRGGLEDAGMGDAAGKNINVPLPPGCGGGAYLHAFDEIVRPALSAFEPEFLVLAAGYDASISDPMAAMMLTSTHYRAIADQMVSWADAHARGKLLVVHEGGYSADYVPFCGLAVIESMRGAKSGCVDPLVVLNDHLPGQALQPHQAAAIARALEASPLLS